MATKEDFERFEDYYDDAKTAVDKRIVEVLDEREDISSKRRLLQHSTTGGKRVRPVLTMLTGDVYETPTDKTLNHATIVELIHTASLISDDRYDEDSMRRGKPTFHKVLEKVPFGSKGQKAITGLSVMGANGLVGLAIELVEDPDVLQAVGHGIRKLVDGFFEEGMTMFSGIFGGGYDRYIEVNKAKTGGLFALSTWMPATYVDVPEEDVEAARKYGETVGILYQIADDIADGDLPSFVTDPEEELEKWHDRALDRVGEMPDGKNKDLLRVAPSWVVYKMFEQEGLLGEVEPDFLPAEVTA
jgi:geranylgeranyl pyrophosphate synthase